MKMVLVKPRLRQAGGLPLSGVSCGLFGVLEGESPPVLQIPHIHSTLRRSAEKQKKRTGTPFEVLMYDPAYYVLKEG